MGCGPSRSGTPAGWPRPGRSRCRRPWSHFAPAAQPTRPAPPPTARRVAGGTADRRRLGGVIDPTSALRGPAPADRPVVVVAFEGWNDAGDAATGAVEHLELIWDAKPLAALDPEDYYDFQVNRPTVSLVGGVSRRIEWPTTRISVARPPGSDRDVVLIRGIEPNMRWRGVLRRADRPAARARRRRSSSPSGALLADTPHTRPTPVTGSAYDAESARAYGLETSRYEGPTGILGVFQDACVQAGLPGDQLLGRRPALRVAAAVARGRRVALLQRVEEVLELTVPLGALPQQAEDWVEDRRRDGQRGRRGRRVRALARGAGHRGRPLAGQRRHDRPRVRALPPPPRQPRAAEQRRRRSASRPTWRTGAASAACVERGSSSQRGTLPGRGCGPRAVSAAAASCGRRRRRRRAGRACSARTGRSSRTRSRRPG